MKSDPAAGAPFRVEPITLEGDVVRLCPLRVDDLPELVAVGCDPDLWAITVNDGGTPDAMRRWVERALADQQRGTALPFVTRLRDGGTLVGATRFGNIDAANRRVEIGWTFVARPWQRSGVNRDAKRLMLAHAFETWRCLRVEFKTDAINAASRRALLGIGAVEEGILRKHQVTWTGRVRDSVYFSIVDDEWPAVRERLTAGSRR